MKDALGSVRSVFVLGAGSDIAQATVRELVADRATIVILAARKPERLEPFAAELRSRGATDVRLLDFDADAFETHAEVVGAAFDAAGDVDLALVAFGVLGDQLEFEGDPDLAVEAAQVNYVGGVSVCLRAARLLRAQGHGTLVVLSSVAGERARRSNFVYGSTKAGLDSLASGLADALHGSGAHVLVVRPGFVRTGMT